MIDATVNVGPRRPVSTSVVKMRRDLRLAETRLAPYLTGMLAERQP